MVKIRWIQQPITNVYEDSSQSARHSGCGAALDNYYCPSFTPYCERNCPSYCPTYCPTACGTRDGCVIFSCGSRNCNDYSCGIFIG